MPHIADRHFEMSPYNGHAYVVSARDGMVQMDERRLKVAIVGAGHGRDYAPYDDPEWEVWGLNAVPPTDRFGRLRADRWFDIHVMAAQNENDMRWILGCPMPIYLVPQAFDGLSVKAINDRYINGPTGAIQCLAPVRYPLEKVEAKYGSYFTCTFAYQAALALLEGFTDIGIYGCELCYGTERERTVEWACLSWWLGLAEGLGKTVHLPPGSHLGRHKYRYGIEYYEEKKDVEHYVDMLRKGDARRHVVANEPYDSAKEFSQGG